MGLGLGLALSPSIREGVGFTPLSLFAGGRGGAWYDPSDKAILFQDVAATTPVTAVGQEVRYIGDKSGNGNHLTILTTGTPGFYQEANGHGYVDASVNGCSFKSVNNKTLQMPRYIAGAYRKTTSEDNPLFGIIKGASDMHALRGYTALNRAHSWLQGNSIAIAGIPNPISPGERGPINSLVVEDTLAVVGTVDIGANGLVETSAANNWLVGSAIPACVYGLNMIGTGSTSNTNQHFYGGLILEAEPTSAERAATVRYFRSRIERPTAASDINILVIGDSTGDKVPAGAGDTTGEWPWRFALDKLASDATAFVGIRTYDETNRVYGPEIVVQQGTGGPTYGVRQRHPPPTPQDPLWGCDPLRNRPFPARFQRAFSSATEGDFNDHEDARQGSGDRHQAVSRGRSRHPGGADLQLPGEEQQLSGGRQRRRPAVRPVQPGRRFVAHDRQPRASRQVRCRRHVLSRLHAGRRLMRGGVEVHEAIDAALNAEGEREPSHAASGIQPNQHRRSKVRRLVLRVISELPEDLTVQELREALEE